MGIYKRKPDIIIRNGCIVDGTGKLPYYADIAVIGDKIDYIGDLKGVEAAKLDIDAHHKYVTPGFIDSHTHSDFSIWANPEAQSSVRQGITTEIVGNCGHSLKSELSGCEWDEKGASVSCCYDMTGPEYPEGSMAAVLDKADAMGASINTAWLCGHNSLRIMADCYTEDYSEKQFDIMAGFLREAMEAGFFGFSTGLDLVPGIKSKPEEIERLAQIAAEYDGNYSTHMRDEGTYMLEAVNEFLNVIRKSGIRGTASHLHLKYHNGTDDNDWTKGVEMMRRARDVEHLNVYCDMLPTPFATGGTLAILPPWLYEKGWEEAKKTLASETGRAKVKADCNRYWRFLAAGEWDRLLFIQPEYMPEICRTPFKELVEESGKDPFDYLLDVVMAAPTLEAAANIHMQGNVFHEQQLIDTLVKDPIYIWMTDATTTVEEGQLAENIANVQNYMSMTYYFVRYVRELKTISIQDAVAKVGMIPAHHYHIEKRGVLKPGNYADINVFNLDDLKINASFSDVCRYSSGFDYVIVNGTPVIAQGEHTGERTGKVLRHLPKD